VSDRLLALAGQETASHGRSRSCITSPLRSLRRETRPMRWQACAKPIH
jgi:hypothetical protein